MDRDARAVDPLSGRLRVRYELAVAPGEDGGRRAAQLAREQSVECAEGIAPAAEALARGGEADGPGLPVREG